MPVYFHKRNRVEYGIKLLDEVSIHQSLIRKLYIKVIVSEELVALRSVLSVPQLGQRASLSYSSFIRYSRQTINLSR